MKDLFDLTGKVIVVSGGAGHLGRPICESMAQYGATLVIASRNKERCFQLAEELSDRFGKPAMGEHLDILDTGSIRSLYGLVTERYRKIDVLINNACVFTPGFLEDLTDELWDEGMDGTINGVFKCVREALPYMLEKKYGKIINIASMYGVIAPNPAAYGGETNLNSPANYGAGKAAVIQFTKYIASYYGGHGITANCISPGSFPKEEILENRDFISKLNEKTMLGRSGFSDEIKGTAVFLASDASSYITGQNICVDGGVTSW